MVVAALRNLVKRISADWLILGAGAVTILLAMVLLGAGPIYADAVTESALRRSLDAAPPSRSTVVASARAPSTDYETVDEIATSEIDEAFNRVDVQIVRVLEAETLNLPDDNDDELSDIAQVSSMERIEEHTSLLDGAWPDATRESAVSRATADLLGLAVGDTLTLGDPRSPGTEVHLAVVGVFQPNDPEDPYWLEDRLALDGLVESGTFRTFGPFVVDEGTIAEITPRVAAQWRTYPDFTTLAVNEAASVRGRVAALPQRLNEALAGLEGAGTSRISDFEVDTGLDRLLAGTERSLTVTRSSVIALVIQLAALAGYALALTAGLLIDVRRTETSLVSARGASPGQVAAVAALEGLLLVVPASLVAPSLAAWTLEGVAGVGPLSSVGLAVTPAVTDESRIIAFIAAGLAVVALSWPAWRSARAVAEASRPGSRQRARSRAQRAGVDIALLGLTVLAFWQLRSLGPQVSATIQGRFGVDPVLIAAPSLGLLAGSVLALRIVPLLARAGERIASTGKGTVPALSSWQVARRPLRYARSALLLIMAVSIGFFAAAYSATWLDSQRDQADFQVGADVRILSNRGAGSAASDLYLITGQESIEGVTRSMPVSRVEGPVPGSDRPGEYLLIDSSVAPEVVEFRDDLAPDFPALMARLEEGRFTLPGIDLPGEPDRVGVIIAADEEEIEAASVIPDFGGAPGELLPHEFAAELSLVLTDGRGLLHRLTLGPIEVDTGRQTIGSRLTGELDGGNATRPEYPLRVVAVEIASRYPFLASRTVALYLVDLMISSGDGPWQRLGIDVDPETWMEQVVPIGSAFEAPRVSKPADQPTDALRLELETGVSFDRSVAVFAVRLPSTSPPTYPVVAASSWLDSSNHQVGDEVLFDRLRTGRSVAIVAGAIEAFPATTPRSTEVVIADLPTYQAIRYAPGSPIAEVTEHWLSVADDIQNVTEALGGSTETAFDVQLRAQRFIDLSTDPVALGTIGALSIGFVAAAVFAAVGFAVSATVSARERVTEFGLLRALGLSPRQLGLWITVEQSVLVVSSLAFGTLVGWALTTVILPLVTVTQAGERPFPDVAVVYPWGAVALLQAGLIAVLTVIVVVMTLLLRRLGLGSLLRLGEE